MNEIKSNKNAERVISLHPIIALRIALLSWGVGFIIAVLLIRTLLVMNIKEVGIPILTYPALAFIGMFGFVGVYFYQKRNRCAMIFCDVKIIRMKAFAINRRLSVFDYFTLNEWKTLKWEDMEAIFIDKTMQYKKGIFIKTKEADIHYVPFVYRSTNERNSIYAYLQQQMKESQSLH